MRLSILGALIFAVLVFSSCEKESSKIDSGSDDALIEAIQNANNKHSVNIGELPTATQSVLTQDYDEDYVNAAMLAPELGYEIDLRCEKGPNVGEYKQAYFDMNGRHLKHSRDKGDKDGWNKEDGNTHKKRCFELVLPVAFTMPDESEITVENKEDWGLIKAWYEAHPDSKKRPDIQYPVDVEFKDGTTMTVNSDDEMKMAFRKCDGDGGDDNKRCFEMVYPVTYIMPDGSEITLDSKEDHELIKEWYTEHPDYDAKPELKFPVDIKWYEGTVQTINNKEEMMEARKKCGDDGHHKKRCFRLVLPVTYTMPDDSEITIENKEDRMLIKQWYIEHPDVAEKPTLNYPVDIKYKDGTIVTINNQEEMMEARKNCGDDTHKKRCFRLVLPVTYIMPDGTEITIENKEDRILIKDWYIEHPDVEEKPELDYPVDIAYFDNDAVVTINNKEEMMAAKEDCKDGDED